MILKRKYKFWFLDTNGLSVAGFWCTDGNCQAILTSLKIFQKYNRKSPLQMFTEVLVGDGIYKEQKVTSLREYIII